MRLATAPIYRDEDKSTEDTEIKKFRHGLTQINTVKKFVAAGGRNEETNSGTLKACE
jgi:soluble cytochrome b562